MKQVIQGLEEGLQAIAEALEGSGPDIPTPAAADEGKVLTAGDDGTASWEDATSDVPTPALVDEGKVLRVVAQGQETVAPEWGTVNEVPPGGTNGQVLTKGASGYSWANPTGGSYPEPTSATDGQVLTADGLGGASWETPSGGGGGSTITKEIVSLNQSGVTIDTMSSQNAALVTIPGYYLSSALGTALNNEKILTARIMGGDEDFGYLIDCIGYYFDEKSNELILYFRNADVDMLVTRTNMYFYFYA